MFSVVIPLYNKVLSIQETLESVLNQTFQDFEVLVVNDGSTDGSAEIVQKFEDSRIKLINKENGGVSSARNKGILEAKFDWIAFLDADDLWETQKLEYYALAINNDPSISWIFSKYSQLYKGRAQHVIFQIGSGKVFNIFEEFSKGIKIHTSTVVVKKQLFLQRSDLWFRVGLNNSEDREVWYKLCCLDKTPYFINKPLSKYIIDDQQSLTKNVVNISKNHFLSMEERLKTFTKDISITDRKLLLQFLDEFNEIALINQWKIKRLDSHSIKYIKSRRRYLVKTFNNFPSFFKKAINKLFL